MSDENSTRFHFALGAVELEISGERTFVERMYRKIMQDIEAAREHSTAAVDDTASGEATEEARGPIGPMDRPIVWVHRCSEMMHKIYMSSPQALERAKILRAFDTSELSVVYVDKRSIERVIPKSEKTQTLWAELTEAGRKKIAAAVDE